MKNDTLTTGFFLCRHRKLRNTLAAVVVSVVLAFICAAVASCSQFYEALGEAETITLSVPAVTTVPETAELASGTTATLLWIDATGSVRREPLANLVSNSGLSATRTPFSEETTISKVTLTVSKGLVTPVLLFCDNPRNNQSVGLHSGSLYPKGFIYPYEAEFTEAGGFAAHILYRLIKESAGDKNDIRHFCGRFNWQKFIQCVKKLDNPWECDQTSILNAIADGSFTVRMLR